MAASLRTKIEPGDERRYQLYLSELKKFDLEGKCRRDFFRHMAEVEHLFQYQLAGGFLRKYRPLFEDEVPAWAAKANFKSRQRYALERQQQEQQQQRHRGYSGASIASEEEDIKPVEPPSKRQRTQEIVEAEEPRRGAAGRGPGGSTQRDDSDEEEVLDIVVNDVTDEVANAEINGEESDSDDDDGESTRLAGPPPNVPPVSSHLSNTTPPESCAYDCQKCTADGYLDMSHAQLRKLLHELQTELMVVRQQTSRSPT